MEYVTTCQTSVWCLESRMRHRTDVKESATGMPQASTDTWDMAKTVREWRTVLTGPSMSCPKSQPHYFPGKYTKTAQNGNVRFESNTRRESLPWGQQNPQTWQGGEAHDFSRGGLTLFYRTTLGIGDKSTGSEPSSLLSAPAVVLVSVQYAKALHNASFRNKVLQLQNIYISNL